MAPNDDRVGIIGDMRLPLRKIKWLDVDVWT